MKYPRFRSRYVMAGVVGLAMATSAAVLTTTSAQAATGCRVSYAVSSQWQGGFGAQVTITNLGDAVTSWRLTWSFGAGQTVTQLWNGSVTQSGAQVTVTNASYNGTIATGANTAFGFNGAWNGSNPVPTDFALNGTVCNGPTGGPTSSRPTTAGPTTAGPTTAGPTTAGPTTAGPTTARPTTAGPTTAGPTSAVVTTRPPTSAVVTSGGPTPGCSATYKVTSSWGGGFQGEVTVRNNGTATLNGWTATWTNPSGVTITQLWNGTMTTSGSTVTVRNLSWNGTLGSGATTTFGFLANGPSTTVPTVTCTSP